VHPEYQPPRAGDIRHSRADIAKAERMLGYHPLIGFHTGLEQTVTDYLQRRATA
jgi:nucleoside-diphosphate-sugar epimerase